MDRKEWLKWRHGGLGGSDAPIVMGVSDFMTPLQLWEKKILPEPPDEEMNYVQRLGTEAEPRIREVYNFMHNANFQPSLSFMAEFPRILVSLDGSDPKLPDDLLEIKLASAENHKLAQEGKLPAMYWPQVQHQLMVTGKKWVRYISYPYAAYDRREPIDPALIVVVHVEPDLDYMKTLFQEELKFLDLIDNKKPPVASDRDFKKLKGVAKAANKFARLKLKIEALDTELQEARGELILAAEAANHPRLLAGRVKLLLIPKIGNVDNKKVSAAYEERVTGLVAILDKHGLLPKCFEMKPIVSDDYRGKGSTYWKVDV